MAAIATRSAYPAGGMTIGMPGNHFRTAPNANAGLGHGVFTSPTESEFSDSYRSGLDAVQDWDESRVCDWLASINCGQYVDIFRKNNITGENLLEMDQAILKEMGIKKIGDRVRISSHAKRFRNASYGARSPSPMTGHENANSRARRPAPSPLETGRKDSNGYTQSGPPTARFTGAQRTETPLTARLPPVPPAASMDDYNPNSGSLPKGMPLIRVIYETGHASVINISNFRTSQDIIRSTLRKGNLNENHHRSYCFYILDGLDPSPMFCRRLGEAELCKLCDDDVRSDRGRLILRKIHAGEPSPEQLKAAARIAESQLPEPPAIEVQAPQRNKNKLRLDRSTGKSSQDDDYVVSPASTNFDTQSSMQRNASSVSTTSQRARKLKDFYGARPPTELITQDLQSYFPEVAKEEMDNAVRMSIRRSRRLSRAVRTLSMASNFSVASSLNLKDAPPLPTIADTWLKDANASQRAGLRPLSVVRLGRSDSHRMSVASSILSPLDEESPITPNHRRSYASFADSNSDIATGSLAVTDPDGRTSFFEENMASSPVPTDNGSNSDSLNSRLSRFIAEDGEELDEELMQHLEKSNWDDLKYMKGAMIGQGSFGTVFLALHAVTAELMAVKQVEMPSNDGSAMTTKKNNMIEALKHEISLLRDMKHPNIVQYLGSNSDETHLNIFLEYVAGGSVATMLVNYGSLPEPLIANFVRQILEGLNYLHSKDIIHRDIKGANILVDNKGTVKISDFGISKRVEASTLLNSANTTAAAPAPKSSRANPRVSLQGSVFWMAPEVVRQTAYTKKADIWSLGCLIVEMFTGSHPHPNCTQLQAIFKIGGAPENARPDIPTQASAAARDFLRRTFEIEHELRPSAMELMELEFCAAKA
ncbi:Pkinase-domain-containing protein [Dissoconium aciculare CBS 342.82]|uniref:mitogen-activated protein kinase n=1 Tax=Dissoconium aciculare CBS 342.82 TaxID=1314786 RepID=A0A6J3M065_9PEZI|nr:Pkinase-domain-containing protein [Dissoconium aciculare CBS 342.82]KAF1820894.1 Pkinase-domain-containing protein [Dissoconium aciculare CBS 342.82]